MAAAAPHKQQRAGHSNTASLTLHSRSLITNSLGATIRSPLSRSTVAKSTSGLEDDYDAGVETTSSPRSRKQVQIRDRDTTMTSYSSTTTLPTSTRSASGQAKLHKRGGSGSSLPGPPSPFQGAYSHFTTPFATNEEAHPSTTKTSSPRMLPYSRKKSIADEEQGKIDLSKPTVENDRLAGLGIQDFGARSASDVTFAHAGRRVTHARTTSVGSQVSTGSGSYRPIQPFVHPMRQTPRPYTPPTGSSNASFVIDAQAGEESDVVDDDFMLGPGVRTRRSVSISSTPQAVPTPLSQSHTANDLGIVPKLTAKSETNLSTKSGKSAKPRPGRQRHDTVNSFERMAPTSSRPSFDKAFSFVSRRSDPEPQNRDERIRAARRKFEEKEAHKDRRANEEASKRRATEESKIGKKQERTRRKSDAAERVRVTKALPNDTERRTRGNDDKTVDTFTSRSYDEYRPSHAAALPRSGVDASISEKAAPVLEHQSSEPPGGWSRFSAWMQTRVLSCGDKRREENRF